MTFETVFHGIRPEVRRALDSALEGHEVSVEDALLLADVRGRELLALGATADAMRQRQVGDVVTYVVNRNVNFTNVCVKTCKFCAFARGIRSEQGYYLPTEEVVRRVLEAKAYGATEVCIQAGLAPTATGETYLALLRAVKRAAPDIHVHAFSPEEIKFGAGLARLSLREYLLALREAGLGSLPGTSAEILDDALRTRIAPTRIRSSEWIDVITTAHELGIPTTATMMFGHLETAEHRVRHLDLLRSIQRDTGGFTEFVPLSFVHEEAPLFLAGEGASRPGPSGSDVFRLYALARLVLGPSFRNIQASWVKEGLRVSEVLLGYGVNDLGGTLMNESISTAAGAQHGQLTRPAVLRRTIRDAGRVPAERSTRYGLLRTFGASAEDDPREPLDDVHDPDSVFGSYRSLVADERFRYEPREKVRLRLATS